MKNRQLLQALLARRRQADLNQTQITQPSTSFDQTECFTAGHQRNDSMVLSLEPFGKLSQRGPVPSRKAFDLKHELILKWRNPVLLGYALAETQEAP